VAFAEICKERKSEGGENDPSMRQGLKPSFEFWVGFQGVGKGTAINLNLFKRWNDAKGIER